MKARNCGKMVRRIFAKTVKRCALNAFARNAANATWYIFTGAEPAHRENIAENVEAVSIRHSPTLMKKGEQSNE
jgi:hypothetical protein